MKNIVLKFTGLLTCLLLFTAVNCENEPLDENFFEGQNATCAVATQNTAEAALNFLGANVDNYVLLCVNYRVALQAQIQSCGDVNGTLQAGVDALGDCSTIDQSDTCETTTTAAIVAETSFNSATDENYTTLCNAYKTALESKIDACGDEDGSIQAVINGLGDCSGTTQPEAMIVGTWKLTSWSSENPYDLNNDGTQSENLLDEMDCYTNELLIFNEDGTATSESNSYAEISVELVVGTENDYDFTIECIDEIDITNGSWEESDNTVTFTSDGQEIIMTLFDDELSFVFPSGFISVSEDASVEITEDLTFIYTKQ